MIVLSRSEDTFQTSMADPLCRIIEANADGLRSGTLGRRFRLRNARFRLFQKDRNTIYRVSNGMDWFLKMPRRVRPEVIEREAVGAEAVRSALCECGCYQHPQAIRASVASGYVLTSFIEGSTLQRLLYRSLFVPFPRARRRSETGLLNSGAVLAILHAQRGPEQVTTNRPVDEHLKQMFRQTTHGDDLSRAIERRVGSLPAFPTDGGFTHGNFKSSNVIVSGPRVSIVDFENCGQGSVYDDVSLAYASILWIGTAPHVSMDRVRQAARAFLQGYRRHALLGAYTSYRSIDHDILRQTTAARMCDYYLRGFCSGKSRPTALGAPMIRKRVQRVVRALLLGEGRAGQEYVSKA